MTDRTKELIEQHGLVLGGKKIYGGNLIEAVDTLERAVIILDGRINGYQETIWELENKVAELEKEINHLKFKDYIQLK